MNDYQAYAAVANKAIEATFERPDISREELVGTQLGVITFQLAYVLLEVEQCPDFPGLGEFNKILMHLVKDSMETIREDNAKTH